jgi:hypothetical protein
MLLRSPEKWLHSTIQQITLLFKNKATVNIGKTKVTQVGIAKFQA